MRLPTRRQARAVSRLDAAGRAALHTQCPHDLNCPIEAAAAAVTDAIDAVRVAVLALGAFLALVLIGILGPNWTATGAMPDANGDLVAHHVVKPFLFAIAASVAVGAIVLIAQLLTARREALALAAAGPPIDPWEAGLAASRHRTRRWVLAWPREGATALSRSRVLLAAVLIAISTAVGVLSGSWYLGLFAAVWLGLAESSLRTRRSSRHNHPPMQ